jgi:hypothetical protein
MNERRVILFLYAALRRISGYVGGHDAPAWHPCGQVRRAIERAERIELRARK